MKCSLSIPDWVTMLQKRNYIANIREVKLNTPKLQTIVRCANSRQWREQEQQDDLGQTWPTFLSFHLPNVCSEWIMITHRLCVQLIKLCVTIIHPFCNRTRSLLHLLSGEQRRHRGQQLLDDDVLVETLCRTVGPLTQRPHDLHHQTARWQSVWTQIR